MPKTDLESGAITLGGNITLEHCGLSANPGGGYHWYHYAGEQIGPEDASADTTHGASAALRISSGSAPLIEVEILMDREVFEWTSGGGWSPGSSWYGYPAALPTPGGGATYAKFYCKAYVCNVSGGGSSDVAVLGIGYAGYDDMGGYYHSDIADVNKAYTIAISSMKLREAMSQVTTDARAFATCVQQLRNAYWWEDDSLTFSASCGGASISVGGQSWTSILLPVWTAKVIGSPATYIRTYTIPPGPPVPVPTTACLADTSKITFGLSAHYRGLRASGMQTIRTAGTDAYGWTTYGSSYTFAYGEMQLDFTAAENGSPWNSVTKTEWGRARTHAKLNLLAFDQQEAFGESDGLIANVSGCIEGDMVWDAANLKYVKDTTYSDPQNIAVPGVAEIDRCQTSRYEDLKFPVDEDDVVTATLTDETLVDLGLPTADHTIPLFDGALDRLGLAVDGSNNPTDWGAYDDHGGAYTGLQNAWVQSPLSVQFPQDCIANGDSAPPSWWTITAGTGTLDLENTKEAVLTGDDPSAFTILRALAWHPTRRDKDFMGTIEAGYAEADLWKWIGDWNRVPATKHLLEGTVIGGPFDMTAANVVVGEGDTVDHQAYGEMPWSEDVTDWRLYRKLRFIITTDDPTQRTLTLRIGYESDLVTDGYEMDTDDRRAGFGVVTSSATLETTVTCPGSAASAQIDVDLLDLGAPYLERVTWIELSGMIVAEGASRYEFRLEDVQLIPPTAGVWIESTDQRPVRYGGEAMSACGGGGPLGTAKTPEEYGGFWAVGGSAVARSPRDPGRTVSVAPNWGMPFVIRRVPECGASQDYLMDFSAHQRSRLGGTWGLEGFYGQNHIDAADASMADWVDDEDSPLGCEAGSGYITHVPILLGFAIATEDKLSSGRDQDGTTELPVVVRSGELRLCEGIQLAHDGMGVNAPVWGAKHHLRGSMIAQATEGIGPSGGAGVLRVGYGYQWRLWELCQSYMTTRFVGYASTDADGRLRWSGGVNELRHLEFGASGGACPDWDSRSDYLSDMLGPSETTGDLAFGLHHYDPIPTRGDATLYPVTAGQGISAVLAPWAGVVVTRPGSLTWSGEAASPAASAMLVDHYTTHVSGGQAPELTLIHAARTRQCVIVREDGTILVVAEGPYPNDGTLYVLSITPLATEATTLGTISGYGYPTACRHFHTGEPMLVARNATTGNAELLREDPDAPGTWESIGEIGAMDDAPYGSAVVSLQAGECMVFLEQSGEIVAYRSVDDGRTWAVAS